MSRRKIVCQHCHETRGIGGHGWCHRCYERWRYAGKPAAGPPPPRRGDPAQARAVRSEAAAARREDYNWLRECDETSETAAARVGVGKAAAWVYERDRKAVAS